MATTVGLVQNMIWTGTVVCIQIGATPSITELLTLQFNSSDSEALLGFKKSLLNLLVKAQTAGYSVTVTHPDESAEIETVELGSFDISPVGAAIHRDFYCITGSNIPDNVNLVFETSSGSIAVTPDLVRPHWIFVAQLPTSIPAGWNHLRLQTPTWSSQSVPVEVFSGPVNSIRTLYPGAPKTQPYSITLVANGAIEAAAGNSFSSDPILEERNGYHQVVSYCLQNLLTVREDLLRSGNLDSHIRFVSIFDEGLAATAANSLAHELSPNIMETRRTALNPFLSRYGEKSDMVFVVHGSTTHTRASAWFTTDDSSLSSTAYTYDGVNRVHGHFPSIPGSATMPVSVDTSGLTALHEFGHAASDFNNGRVNDLYVDGSSGFAVNKKLRASSTDAIPTNFAIYNGTTYQSDQNRDSIGYPSDWRSYHPNLIDSTRPNLMDNYWLAFDNPLRCRLDQLTYNWFSNRLRAKVFR